MIAQNLRVLIARIHEADSRDGPTSPPRHDLTLWIAHPFDGAASLDRRGTLTHQPVLY